MRVYSCGAVVLAVLGASWLGCGGTTSGGAGENPGGNADASPDGRTVPADDSGTVAPQHDGGADAGADDAGEDADSGDHGSPSTTYPAFTPDVPQIVYNKGLVLQTPNIVTVTWSSDPDFATYQAFGDTIGASTYWHTLNSEYGVGDAVSGAVNHVNITTPPPPSFTDQALPAFVAANAGNVTSGWPAPNGQDIYIVYLPKGTALLAGGTQDLCNFGVGGYHDQVTVGGTQASYAVALHCNNFTTSDLTITSSHELNEAATDPYPTSKPGWVTFDPDHLSYEFFQSLQDETGDACEFFRSSNYTEMEPTFTYPVQRQWSNKSAKAGHNPCVPVMAEPYYNVTLFPDQEDTINVDGTSAGFGTAKTKGFKAALKQPRTFQIGFFSDADTKVPWTVSANVDAQTPLQDQNGNPINNGTATVTIDRPSGINGEKAYVTVTPTAFNSLGVVYIYFKSTLPNATASHYQPILVGGM